jgi:hypothetical protein
LALSKTWPYRLGINKIPIYNKTTIKFLKLWALILKTKSAFTENNLIIARVIKVGSYREG